MAEQYDPKYLAETKAPLLYGITFPLLGVTVIVVLMRLYCRLRIVKKMQNSDYLIMVSMVLLISMSGMIIMQIKTGMGRHSIWSRRRPEVFRKSMKAGYTENILYQAAVGFVKASILTQYLYIASSVTQRRVIQTMLAVVVLIGTFITLAAIFMCHPVDAAFDIHNFPTNCWNKKTANYITSGINVATDVAVFSLPMPILARLTMEKRKKIMLLGVFSLGSIAVVASAARLSNIGLWADGDDFTYDAAMLPVWGAVEINVAIISASIPLLKPIFRRLFPFIHNSHRSAASLAVQESWHRRGTDQHRDPLDWDWDGEANPLTSPTAILAEDKCSSAAVAAAAAAGLPISAMKSSSMSTSVSKPLPLATAAHMELAPDAENDANKEIEKRQALDFKTASSPDTKDKTKVQSVDSTGDTESVYADAEATTQHVEDVEKDGNVDNVSLSALPEPALLPSAPEAAAAAATTIATTTTTTIEAAIAEVESSAEATREDNTSMSK